MKPKVDFSSFSDLDIRVGKIVSATLFKRARNPAYKLSVDFGDEVGILQSSAQLTKRYTEKDLEGKKIVAVVNFHEKNVAGFMSQCLILGAVGKGGDVSLLTPDEPVVIGQQIG